MVSDVAPSLRFVLRDRTRAAHEFLDAKASRFNLSRKDDYLRFLVWHGAVVPALERKLRMNGIARFVPDWDERERGAALIDDLEALGASRLRLRDVQLGRDRGTLLGAAYVLEGSRLGGAMLVRGVDPALIGIATAYLDHGAGLKLWPRFVDILDAAGLSGAEQSAAIIAANETFMLFERELVDLFEPDGAAPG